MGEIVVGKHYMTERIILRIRRTALHPRLVLLFIICGFVPMILISFFTITNIQNEYRDQLNRNYLQSLNVFASSSDSMIETFNADLTAIATHRTTTSRISSGNLDHDFNYQSFLSNTLISNNEIITIEVSSVTDVLDSVRYQIFNRNIYQNPYIRRVAASNYLHYWQILDTDDENIFHGSNSLGNRGPRDEYILATMQIKNPLTGLRIGFVSFVLDTSIFDTLLHSLNEFNIYNREIQPIEFSIIDDMNNVIYSTIYEPGSVINEALTDGILEEQVNTIQLDDGYYNVACTHSEESNLRYICSVKQDKIASIEPTLISFIIMTVIVLFFAIYVMMLFIRSITEPMNRLVTHMRLLGDEGNTLPPPITDNSSDELSELIESYNMAIRREFDLRNRLIAEEKLRQEAEYKALTSLINPHFLYNTLDMINWKAYKEGKKDIAYSIRNLSEFFRLTQKSVKKPYTLADEVELTRMYCRIQEEKNEHRIGFIFDIDEDTLNCEVLNIILQPLVENAVFHGILTPNKEKGTVVISSFISDEMLHMRVMDDGVGFDEKMQQTGDTGTISNYGLKSIRERLHFTFGDNAELHIYKDEKGRTVAEITIPVRRSSII